MFELKPTKLVYNYEPIWVLPVLLCMAYGLFRYGKRSYHLIR
jgi:hypothetical protein